jgi:multidrug efflux system outer membrane protein
MKQKIKNLFLLISLLTLVSCVKPPEHQVPKFSFPSNFYYLGNNTKEWNCRAWWKEFRDPVLEKLIDQALKNNYDLRLASEKILQMQAMVAQMRARRFPWLSISSEASTLHFESSQSVMVGGSIPSTTSNSGYISSSTSNLNRATFSTSKSDHIESYNLSLMASYEVDFWKKLSSAEKAARWQLLATKWNRLTVINTLTAETALKYFQFQYLTAKLRVLKERVNLLDEEVKVLEERYKRGEIPLIQLKQKKFLYYRTLSLIPRLEKEKEVVRQSLSILLGTFKEVDLKEKGKLPELSERLPAFLPSDLLKRRPDIKSAEALLYSYHAQYASVLAERFPKITLTGSLGFMSDELEDFLSGDNFFWKLAAGITTPLFNAGYLKAKAKSAKSQYKQAVIQYAKTVLNAFWEVERCLLTEEKLRKELKVKRKLYQEAEDFERLMEERYRKGVVDLLTLLEAKLNLLQVEDELLEIKFSLLSNRISLYRALGGGTELCESE